MSPDEAPTLSVVLPLFDEEGTVESCVAEVCERLRTLELAYEIVCVDDGSSDSTAVLLDSLAREMQVLVPVHLSRNFGKEAAILAGLEHARGEAVVILDGDLQHPPGLIPEMISRWREGYDVVDAVKADRGLESPFHRFMALVFYRLLSAALGRDLRGASDFKLLDRQVVRALLDCPERMRFFRGLVAWVGFERAVVSFDVGERRSGSSTWSLRKLGGYFVRNLISFSSLPLYIVCAAGFMSILWSLGMGGLTLYHYFLSPAAPGIPTIVLLLVILFSIMQASLGILALYVAVLYEEQKGRPAFLIRDRRARRARSTVEGAGPEATGEEASP